MSSTVPEGTTICMSIKVIQIFILYMSLHLKVSPEGTRIVFILQIQRKFRNIIKLKTSYRRQDVICVCLPIKYCLTGTTVHILWKKKDMCLCGFVFIITGNKPERNNHQQAILSSRTKLKGGGSFVMLGEHQWLNPTGQSQRTETNLLLLEYNCSTGSF